MSAKSVSELEIYKRQIQQYELILETAGEGICGLNQNGEISFANPAAVKMLGWTNTEIVGINFCEAFFSPDSVYRENPEICPIFFALSEGETSHVNTETFFRRDGEDLLVEYICVPIKENDQILGAVITFQDITEQREIELSIAMARDAALDAANVKAAFLANMSHEIRTPLNGVIGMTNLLLETNLENQQLHYAEIIRNSADLLLGIVNDILDFSKIEARKLELESVDFDMESLVRNTIELFKPEAQRKSLAFRSEIVGLRESSFIGDAARLRQVLNNLVSNALKFTEKGEVSVRVEKLGESGEIVSLLFTVQDSGIGINQNQVLFEPFKQADVSTTRRFGGTGLGLAICKELVELMRGEIGFDSEIGVGTKFWVKIPLEISRKDQPESGSSKRDLVSDKFERKSNSAKILIVEDNWINQEIAIGLLRKIGFHADLADNGIQALEKLAQNSYDLIFMDFQMPEMDGLETTRRIRQLEGDKKKTPIIAMTASATQDDYEKSIGAGMNDYLSKPISGKDLERILKNHLKVEKRIDSLDSERNIVQHSLANLIEPARLDLFSEIEAKGDVNFTTDILRIYLSHSNEIAERLVKAFENKDFENFGKLIHALKGSSGNVGLTKMFDLCFVIEEKLENREFKEIEKNFPRLLEEHERISQFLTENI